MSPTSYRTAPPRDVFLGAEGHYTLLVRVCQMPLQHFVARLPKVQLHCHLEGTVQPATFLAHAERYGLDLGARAGVPMERLYAFSGFQEFLLLFRDVSRTLRTPEDFARVARDYVAEAALQNVRYAELFISPSVWTYFQPDLDVRRTVAAIREIFDQAAAAVGIEIALIVDLTRNFGAERALDTARQAIALRDLGVIGVGLGGNEAAWPAELFADAFAHARESGLHCVAHAGEAMGVESIRAALDVLGVERIGHGVRAVEEKGFLSELAARRVVLEVCPTSNRLTGVIAADLPHPIVELHAHGVLCMLDTDDPALFGTTLNEEYLHVGELLGAQALIRMTSNAIDASFASPARKAELHRELATVCAEQLPSMSNRKEDAGPYTF